MKITVCIPSRSRPSMLADCIVSLHARASGKHDVTYIVGSDDDDPETAFVGQMLQTKGLPVKVHSAPRSASLGGMVNVMSRAYPADVYCSLCDDVMAQSPGWDDAIHAVWSKRRDGVWWWGAEASLYAVVSHKWYAASGRIFTDYFPFWWDDVWLLQVWKYVTGKPALRINAQLEDRAPATQRMRDLEFWTDFYWSRAAERRAEANRIRRTLGRPPIKAAPHHELVPNPAFTSRTGAIQAKQGERAPPTPEYLAAKARAEELMSRKEAA